MTNKEEVLDLLKSNAKQMQIDYPIYIEILKSALNQSEQDMQDLTAAVEKKDVEAIQFISHRIKGNYRNLHIDVIGNQATALNDLAKGGDMGVIEEAYKSLLEIMEQNLPLLKESVG